MVKASALFAVAFASLRHVAASPPEQLFLDLDPTEALNGTSGATTVEPWATLYHDAVKERRFGDAIYARYNIDGRSANGTFFGANHSVVEEILIDAVSYRSGYPEIFEDALSFYSTSSSEDTRPDIIEALKKTPTTALERRDRTYGVKCDGHNLAPANDCNNLLDHLGASGSFYYGSSRRNVDYWGDCHLRLGPLRSRPDSSQRVVNNVGHLIYEECRRAKSNGLFVSGYSPQNDGHRKICLSSKNEGCK